MDSTYEQIVNFQPKMITHHNGRGMGIGRRNESNGKGIQKKRKKVKFGKDKRKEERAKT
jgi:hypothetical protein